MNNFRRTIEEVVQVVKIADVTLRKRLAEFKDTASGSLTIEDFRSVWLDETADPPAFVEGLKKEEKKRKLKERQEREESSMTDVSETESAAGARAFKELADRDVDGDDQEGGGGTQDETEGEMAPPPKPSAKALGKRKRSDEQVPTTSTRDRSISRPPRHHPSSDQPEQDGDEEAEEEPEELPDPPELDEAVTAEIAGPLSKLADLTDELDQRDQEKLEKARALTNISSGVELNQSDRLDDLDEDELDCFILTEEEVEMKRRVWMETNKDYLKELAGTSLTPVLHHR
jgi:transcription factor IIIB subunit 2